MSNTSPIEWTDATWNPVTGCTKISAGCKFCYAEVMAKRLQRMGSPRYRNAFDVTLQPDQIDLPARWRKPRRIFVNSMSDLFHKDIPESYIAQVFATMKDAPWHTYQVLTKRADRLAELAPRLPWPEQIQIGVSIEDQDAANTRIPMALTVRASLIFLSVEPMIGPVDIRRVPVADTASVLGPEWDRLSLKREDFRGIPGHVQALEGRIWPAGADEKGWLGAANCVDWVIIGGESGHHARPLDLAWVRDLIAQCRSAGVPVFVKQLGSVWARENGATHPKGGDMAEWPADLRVREMPSAATS